MLYILYRVYDYVIILDISELMMPSLSSIQYKINKHSPFWLLSKLKFCFSNFHNFSKAITFSSLNKLYLATN